MPKRGGQPGNKGGGRKTVKDEKAIFDRLSKLLPKIYKFYEDIFNDKNVIRAREKERISKTVLGKLLADKHENTLQGSEENPLKFLVIERSDGKKNKAK